MAQLIVPLTAVRLPMLAGDGAFLEVIRTWVQALAQEDYRRAYSLTAHEENYGWTPELLQKTVEGYGLPEKHPHGVFKVTPIESAVGGPEPRHEVERFVEPAPDGTLGEIWFDLPLNGSWSDLTATFAIHRTGGKLVVALNEVHVF